MTEILFIYVFHKVCEYIPKVRICVRSALKNSDAFFSRKNITRTGHILCFIARISIRLIKSFQKISVISNFLRGILRSSGPK